MVLIPDFHARIILFENDWHVGAGFLTFALENDLHGRMIGYGTQRVILLEEVLLVRCFTLVFSKLLVELHLHLGLALGGSDKRRFVSNGRNSSNPQ